MGPQSQAEPGGSPRVLAPGVFNFSACPTVLGRRLRGDGSQPPGPLPQDGPLPAVFSTGILLSLPWTGSAAPKVCCLKLDKLTESNHLDLQLKKPEAWRGKVTCPGLLGYRVVKPGWIQTFPTPISRAHFLIYPQISIHFPGGDRKGHLSFPDWPARPGGQVSSGAGAHLARGLHLPRKPCSSHSSGGCTAHSRPPAAWLSPAGSHRQ